MDLVTDNGSSEQGGDAALAITAAAGGLILVAGCALAVLYATRRRSSKAGQGGDLPPSPQDEADADSLESDTLSRIEDDIRSRTWTRDSAMPTDARPSSRSVSDISAQMKLDLDSFHDDEAAHRVTSDMDSVRMPGSFDSPPQPRDQSLHSSNKRGYSKYAVRSTQPKKMSTI